MAAYSSGITFMLASSLAASLIIVRVSLLRAKKELFPEVCHFTEAAMREEGGGSQDSGQRPL